MILFVGPILIRPYGPAGGKIMGFIISGIIAVLLLIYLTYAMFNPEKF